MHAIYTCVVPFTCPLNALHWHCMDVYSVFMQSCMHSRPCIIMQSNEIIVINYYGIQRNMNVIHCQMKATLAAMRCMGQPIKQLHN